MKMTKLLVLPLLIIAPLSYAADYEAKSSAFVGNFITTPNPPTHIYADVYNEVTNNTDKPIWIMAHYNLSVEYCGNDHHQWSVQINPHGTWRDHWRPSKECRFPAGNYRVDAQGTVDGIDKPLHSDNWSYGSVMVR